MKVLLLLAVAARAAMPGVVNMDEQFAGKDGCFILADAKAQSVIVSYGGKRCKERLPACSTFKPALALAAFDSGVLKEDTVLKWDGKKRVIESWNRDHTPATWMRDSVVWFSQQVAPRIGREKLEAYLKDFPFGNADLSGGLDRAWLTTAPFLKEGAKPTLKISADEQVKFWDRWWNGKTKVSPEAVALTKKITYLETSPSGRELHGKTGSGFVGPGAKKRLGWFAGYLSGGGSDLIVVTTFTDKKENVKGFAGLEAKELTKSLLQTFGKW